MGFLKNKSKPVRPSGSSAKRTITKGVDRVNYDWQLEDTNEQSSNLFDYNQLLELNRRTLLNRFDQLGAPESYPASLVNEWIALVTERDRILKLLFVQASRLAVKEHLLAIHSHLSTIFATIQSASGRNCCDPPSIIPTNLSIPLQHSSVQIRKFLIDELHMDDEELAKFSHENTPSAPELGIGKITPEVCFPMPRSITSTPTPSPQSFGMPSTGSDKMTPRNIKMDLGAPLAMSSPSPPPGFCADSVADNNASMVVDGGSVLEDFRLFSRGAGVISRTGTLGLVDGGLNDPLDSPIGFNSPSDLTKRSASGTDSLDYVSVCSSIRSTRSFRSSAADSSTFGDRMGNGAKHSHGQRYFPASLNFPSLATRPVLNDAEALQQKQAAIVEELD